MPSYAEDWYGTPWEILQERKCYPSIETFMKSMFGDNYLDDENIQFRKLSEYKKVVYFIAGDSTADNVLIVHKEKKGEICLIAFVLDGGNPNYKFSNDGFLIEIVTTVPQTSEKFSFMTIIYSPNKQGRFFPRKCAFEGESGSEPFSCHSIIGRIPPSFDCSNLKKLSLTEQAICKDGYLSELDSRLDSNYRGLRTVVSLLIGDVDEYRNKLVRTQREWIKHRNECRDNKNCLSDAYRERIIDLCNNYLIPASQLSCDIPAPY
jgi:uncharacterized protein YecT (DUF1311 family)